MDARVNLITQQFNANYVNQSLNQTANQSGEQLTTENQENVVHVQTPKISLKPFVMSEEDIRALLMLVVRGTGMNEIRQKLAANLKNAG